MALPVTAITSDQETMITLTKLREFVDRLCGEEEFESTEGEWSFRSGGCCCRCTDAALKVAQAFGGRVVGYNASDNVSALIGEKYCEGHDFALIDDRFIVDYWAYRVVGAVDRPVLDLSEPSDEALVNQLYGSKETWEVVEVEDGSFLRRAST